MGVALPRISPTQDNKYVLLDDYKILNVTVPKYYKTNGANIPRVFWFIIPPFKPKYLPAVIVHDYLCDKEEYTRADEMFTSILHNIEKSWKTTTMIWAVKAYHKIKYGDK